MYGDDNTKKASSCVLSVFNSTILLALHYTIVIVLCGVIASPNKDSLSIYNTRYYMRILTSLDDSTGQNSEFCIVSENLVSQNPDVLKKTDYRFEISDPKLPN